LQKAFDCINHSIFLAKLELYGITDGVYSLMKSYLEKRYQREDVSNDSTLFLNGGK